MRKAGGAIASSAFFLFIGHVSGISRGKEEAFQSLTTDLGWERMDKAIRGIAVAKAIDHISQEEAFERAPGFLDKLELKGDVSFSSRTAPVGMHFLSGPSKKVCLLI